MAEEAHLQLSESVGISRERALSYGFPPPAPSDGAWVSICIDDTIAVDDEDGDAEEVFLTALGVYDEHGMPPKEEKTQRGVNRGTILGAYADGPLSAPLKNLSQLMMLNLMIVREPWLRKKAFQKLLGSWIFPLMFRREAFATYHQVFKDLQTLPERREGRLGAGDGVCCARTACICRV